MRIHTTRREFTLAGLGTLLAGRFGQGKPTDKIQSIDFQGMLVGHCTLYGETRKDDVVPAHPNGIQVSRDRWLVLYATRGFRGVDDDRSIVYQLRKNGFDGPLIREGMLAQAREYQPFADKKGPGDDKAYFKQHGHPVVFGVPKGARLGGKPAESANLFVAKWRAVARLLDKKLNLLEHGSAYAELGRQTQAVEWLQFRLNEQEDDIEIVQPVAVLRQKGFESGPAFCSAEKAAWMNQSFTPPVPFNRDGTEWADCNHFDQGRVAALKYRYNRGAKRYEWVETGPMLGAAPRGLSEASLARLGEQWVIAARPSSGGVAWARMEDPFQKLPLPIFPKEPGTNAPVTAFTGPDGVLRLFSGDASTSPHKNGRDPLYCWDVDPQADFACGNRRVIFDCVRGRLPIRPAAVPKLDMCKLLAHQGRRQLVVWRVSVRSYNHPYVGGSGKPTGIPPINAEEKAACGIYSVVINYAEEFPGPWNFA